MRLYCIPAYMRVYPTPSACGADWLAGKDFKIACGPYLSIRDVPQLKAQGYRSVRITQDNDFVLDFDL